MEQKFREYRKYDWTLSDKWQQYLSNIYPIPPRDKLEKMRKKWYRDNIDKEFDLSYEPTENDNADQPTRQQQQPRSGYQDFMNKQQQQYAQGNQRDVLPAFKSIQWILWSIFYITMPLRIYTNWFALAALISGVIKRYGMPKFSKAYFQQTLIDENLQMIPYLGVVAVASGGSLILYLPLFIHGFLEIAPTFKDMLNRNPNTPILSISFLKNQIEQGTQNRQHFIIMKADAEVWIGLYLIVVWFIGWSSVLTIMMYWQIQRLRYMINTNQQAAFKRINIKINAILNKPYVPAIVRTLYAKVSGFISSMGEMEGAANGQAAGGRAGGMFSKCAIF